MGTLLRTLQRGARVDIAVPGGVPTHSGTQPGLDGERICLRCIERAEDDRRRIAMDLHDGPLQQLINLAMRLDMARDKVPPEAVEARAELDGLLEYAHQQVVEMRRFMAELRPAAGLPITLAPLLHQYVEDYAAASGISVDLRLRQDDWILGDAAEAAIFRIVQEALVNVRKHARASRATVALERIGNRAELTIADNGRGFDVAEARARARSGRSLGLTGMEERAAALGGDLSIRSRPGETRVRATFPVP